MIKTDSLSVVLCLPLIIMSWQGASCSSTKNFNRNGNRSANVDTVVRKQGGPDLKGVWGGDHISMEVSDGGAEINYDCAHGNITERIVVDRDGQFTAKGTHSREHPGPIREGENSTEPATYSGKIDGDLMNLTVTLTRSQESVGTFTLTRGKSGRVRKCA